MNFTPANKPELPGFQMTPMMDVVFLLLCFFVTATLYSQWEYDVDIQLPSAMSAKPPDRLPGEIIVNLSEAGAITINERTFTPEQLLERLRMLARHFPGHPIVLRSDRRTQYEHVLQVIDLCRQADIDNIRFASNLADPDSAVDSDNAAGTETEPKQ